MGRGAIVLVFASSVACASAPVDAGGTEDATDTVGDPPDFDPSSECEGRLSPVEPRGEVLTVGDGTAASCSEAALHAAVSEVNDSVAGGTVLFDCGGEHTIELTQSVFVGVPMVLDGGGETTLSGGGQVRVIELDHDLDFVLQRITIRDGFVAAGSANESGAGLLSPWFGTLEIIDTIFENNHSASTINDVGGGAVYAGGLTHAVISNSRFIANSGSIGGGVLSRSSNLTVVDSLFFENRATSSGEGQYGNGGGLYIDRMWLDDPREFVVCGSHFANNHAKIHGSALFSYNLESRATIDRCSFVDNDMEDAPEGGTGTVYHEGESLWLLASTFSGNSTGAHAGGLFLGGGTDAEVLDCTFTANSTPGNAGALWAGNGEVAITNTTFADNSGDYAPAIFKGEAGQVTLTNVLFAANTTANEFSALACHETFVDGGGNLQWPEFKNDGNPDTPCAAGIVFGDPQLSALADNGGPTATMALGEASAALDLGSDCPAYDQRGVARGVPCDAGAYER